jgi:hypothetical protein
MTENQRRIARWGFVTPGAPPICGKNLVLLMGKRWIRQRGDGYHRFLPRSGFALAPENLQRAWPFAGIAHSSRLGGPSGKSDPTRTEQPQSQALLQTGHVAAITNTPAAGRQPLATGRR